METFGFYEKYYDPGLIPNSFDGKSYEQLKSTGDSKLSQDFKLLMKCFDSLEQRVMEHQLIYENFDITYENPLERALGINNEGHARYTILNICNELTTEKIRQDDYNDNDLEFKRIKFVNQGKVVTDVWSYIVYRYQKLCRVMFQRYDEILKDKKEIGISDKYQYEICFYKLWIFCYDDFLKVMKMVRFIFDYFIDSFSKVIIANQSRITGDVIMHTLFFKTLADTYKDQMEVFVHDFINTRRQCEIIEDAGPHMLIRPTDDDFWLHLINLPLGIDVKKNFLENIKRYYSKFNQEKEYPLHDRTFSVCNRIDHHGRKECSLGNEFEDLDPHLVRQVVSGAVLVEGKLFETIFKDCLSEPYTYKKRKKFVETYLHGFDFDFAHGFLNHKYFVEEEKRVITNYIHDSYKTKDKAALFTCLLKIQGFFIGKEWEELVSGIVKNYLAKNNLSLIDLFMERFEKEVKILIETLRWCGNDPEGGKDIRTLNHHDMKLISKPERPHFSLYLKTQMVKMPKRYEFGSYLPKVMLDFYFRELIRNFGEFSKLLTMKNSLPLKLIQQLNNDYSTSDDMTELDKLYRSIVELYKMGPPDNGEDSKNFGMSECDALILQRNQYYDSLSQNDYKDMKLPNEIVERWEVVKEDYEKQAKNSDFKTIVPVYQLQRCEVNSPYKIPNSDRPLLLDLTLYQTCVLQEFNDKDELSFNELHTLTNLDKNILQAVLKSFVSAGIMTKAGANVRLNLDYQPNMDKIEFNKIAIPMSKISTGPSDKTNTKSTSGISKKTGKQTIVHKEGLGSYWKQELLKAAIVRTVKASDIKYTEQELIVDVRNQVNDFSVGEFNAAMTVLLRDKYIFKIDGKYAYNME